MHVRAADTMIRARSEFTLQRVRIYICVFTRNPQPATRNSFENDGWHCPAFKPGIGLCRLRLSACITHRLA